MRQCFLVQGRKGGCFGWGRRTSPVPLPMKERGPRSCVGQVGFSFFVGPQHQPHIVPHEGECAGVDDVPGLRRPGGEVAGCRRIRASLEA